MSFRLFLFIVCIAVASALTMGCSKESEPTSPPLKINLSEKSTCFKNISETFEHYFENQISDGEISNFWTCASSALQMFESYAKGKNTKENYTPGQLSYFVSTTFLKGERLPEALVSSVMNLKVAWFGGSTEYLTREELRQFQVWFAEFSDVMIMLKPYVPVYMADQKTVTHEELVKAEIALILAAERIGSLPAQRGKVLEAKDFAQFLNELEKYLTEGQVQPKNHQSTSPTKKWNDILPLAMSVKKLIFGTPETVIALTDWKGMLSIAARGFMLFRHADYGVIKAQIESPMLVKSVEHISAEVHGVISPVFQRRKSQPITETELKVIFDQLEKSQLVSLKSQQLMQIYGVVQDLFKADSTKDKDFHYEDFLNILNEIANWKQIHNKLLAEKDLDTTKNYEFFLQDLITKNQNLQLDNNGEFLMPSTKNSLDARGQLHIHWRAFVIDKLLKKYGTEAGWKIEQLKPLQQSLSSLFEEKYLKKIFGEANLFTLVSDGNDVLSPSEALQYLSMVLSGVSSSSRIQKMSNSNLSVSAVQSAVWQNKNEVFDHIPLLGQYLSDESTWVDINKLLMKTVKDKGSLVTPWTSWELAQSQILALYLEGFMKRFDENKDQVIDHDEAMKAFKIFAPILGPLVAKVGVDEKELPTFFLFLIKYGDTPFTIFGGDVLYTHWKWNPDQWKDIRSDRKILLSILATLSTL